MIKLGQIIWTASRGYWLVKVPGGYAIFETNTILKNGWFIAIDGNLKKCRDYVRAELERASWKEV